VEAVTPKGFTVQKVTPKNLVGYWTRRGYGLPETPPSDPEAKDPKPSTAMPVLLSTFPGHEFITELQQWSKLRKVITTYLDAYPKFTHEGRLYGHFNQTGTKTGRLSSARPNLQNQPAHGELGEKVRGLFEGRLVIGDYSQLEPRLMAHFSQDEKLLEVYEQDLDIYAVTAAGIFGGHYRDYDEHHPKRKMSKPLFLGDQYGAGFKKLTMLLRLNGFDVTPDEVKRFQSKMHAYFGTLTAYKEDVVREAHKRGHVATLDGHRRRLAVSLRDRSWKNRGYGERQAVNAVVQGSAGDVVRRCMVRAHEEFPMLKMLAQVHDEVLWEPEPEYEQSYIESILPDLQYVMEVGHEFNLSVPLKFEPVLANTWADKGMSDIEWPEEDPDGEG
jgi:DNA polymerase-1